LVSAIAQDTVEEGFDRFQLHADLSRGLDVAGFKEPRPIQAETIPACLEGRDIMGLAQTGTGKTAAFALPILQRLLEEPGRGPLVLILAPTRELAIQINEEIKVLSKFADIESTTLFGGVPLGSQVRALKRDPEILVGCPGRVLDLIKQKKLDVRGIDTLVLDEADHMFDMGFLPDLKRILAALPDDRQNLLFSATMPKAIRSLASGMLNDPHVVELAPSAPAEQIEHGIYETDSSRKRGLLEHILDKDDCNSAIVFTRTKHRAKRMAQQLERRGLRAVGLQGNMSQGQRERAMGGFREGKFDVLVATDIAARGIDVAGVDYVINFDVPNTAETYTHRIGRTGRSDAKGKAITFVTSEDRAWMRDTERMLGSKLPRYEAPEVEAAKEIEGDRRPNGRGSRRPQSRSGAKSGSRSKSSSSRGNSRGEGGGGGGGRGGSRRGGSRSRSSSARS